MCNERCECRGCSTCCVCTLTDVRIEGRSWVRQLSACLPEMILLSQYLSIGKLALGRIRFPSYGLRKQRKRGWVYALKRMSVQSRESQETSSSNSNSNSSERYELSSRPSTWKRIAQCKGKRAADPCQVDWTAREIGKGLGWRVVLASQARALIGCLDAPF